MKYIAIKIKSGEEQIIKADSIEVIKQEVNRLGGVWNVYEHKYRAETSVVVTEVRPVTIPRSAVSDLERLLTK